MGQISHLMGLRRDEIHLLPFHFYPLEGKLKNGGVLFISFICTIERKIRRRVNDLTVMLIWMTTETLLVYCLDSFIINNYGVLNSVGF